MVDSNRASPYFAIDFETANEQPGSPCSVGWAIVENELIIDVGTKLIRPPAFRFNERNIAIHGIRPEDVVDSDPWNVVLDFLVEKIEDRPLVAHNASFDMGVIHQACDFIGIAAPSFQFACSRDISRAIWPEFHSHALGDVADSLGFPPFHHHDAGSDAKIAAQIVLRGAEAAHCLALEELLATVGINLRTGPGDSYHAFGGHDGNHRIPRKVSEGVVLDETHPLFGMKVAFTGDLASMDRPMAQQAVLNAGGRPMTNVSKNTNIVVVGSIFSGLLPGHASSKYETARSLVASGIGIQLISEEQFIALLGTNTPSA